MKKFLAILLTVMLLAAVLPATSFAAGAVSNSSKTVYRVTAKSGLWLHSAANDKVSTRIVCLPKGAAVQYMSKSGSWYKVKHIKSGKIGWLSKKYLSKGADAKVTTKNTGLNVRSGPGEKYKLLGSLPRGTTVRVDQISGSWYHVTYKKMVGWSSSTYSNYKVLTFIK